LNIKASSGRVILGKKETRRIEREIKEGLKKGTIIKISN